MDSRKPLCIILWTTQVLFVLLAAGFMVLWALSALGIFGENGFWILTPEKSGALEPIISIITFVLVGGNYFLLQVVCDRPDKDQPSLGGPKKLTNRTYRQYIRYRFRDFNVKGLSTHGPYTLELARVYVELSVAPKPFHAASSNIIQLPEKLQSGRHDIWAYLRQTEQNFAIIGPPGSGKTTLLSHIALTLTQSWFKRRKEGVPNKLPILLTLLEHAEAIAAQGDEPFAMEDAVRADLKKWKKEVPEGWVRRSLDKGKYFVLLDGLDEVADKAQRQKVVAWVERQMKAYPKCQFVVTSRPHGYRTNPIAGVTTLEIRPYGNRQQAQFIRNWYLANEVMSRGGKEDAGVRMAAKEGADDLLRRLGDTPNLAELAVNPLLLTMIATVHRFRSALPKRRVELYDEIFSVFLGTWRGARGIEQELTPDQRKQVLQPLAWAMMEQKVRQISTEEAREIIRRSLRRVDRELAPKYFLEIVRYQSGLLVERENGFLAFAHLTFQEYLAAMHIQNDKTLLNAVLTQVRQSWWHETLLLYSAKQDATQIIEACISVAGGLHPEGLMLALDCNEEASQIAPETREKLERVLTGAIEGDSVDEIRRIVAEAWLQRRLNRMSRLSDGTYIDSFLITNLEYQTFLDEKCKIEENRQPDHWHENHYPKGEGQQPIVGVRQTDARAFCKWLTEKSNGRFIFRLPTSREVDISTGQFLQNGYWIQDSEQTYIELPKHILHISIESLEKYLSEILEGSLDLHLDRLQILKMVRTRFSANSEVSVHVFDRFLSFFLILLFNFFLMSNRITVYGRIVDLIINIRLPFQSYIDRFMDPWLNRAFNRALDFNPDHFSSLNMNIDQLISLCLDRADVQEIPERHSLEFSLFVSLARMVEHCISQKRSPNIENILGLINLLNVETLIDAEVESIRTRSLFHSHDSTTLRLRKILFWSGFQILLTRERLNKEKPFQQQNVKNVLEKLAADYFDAFADLCILEERKKGNLSAFEGIRIVRQRV